MRRRGPCRRRVSFFSKALELGHKVIVVINKIDRPDARIEEVEEEVLELLLDLNATDEQLDIPDALLLRQRRYGIAHPIRKGRQPQAAVQHHSSSTFPRPMATPNAPLQLLVSSIDYNDYVGRIGIGRIERGAIKQNQDVMVSQTTTLPTQRPKRMQHSFALSDRRSRQTARHRAQR